MDQGIPTGQAGVHFVIFVTEHRFPAAGHVNIIGFGVPVPNAIPRAFQRKLPAFFTFAERIGSFFDVGDVADDAENALFIINFDEPTG